MVRRGSTVRVRQRASEFSPAKPLVLLSLPAGSRGLGRPRSVHQRPPWTLFGAELVRADGSRGRVRRARGGRSGVQVVSAVAAADSGQCTRAPPRDLHAPRPRSPRTHVRSSRSLPRHGDNDLPSSVSLFEIAKRLRGLAQRIRPVDDRGDFVPMRASTRSSGSAARISDAARNARSASSSCAAGTPNTAITASPMNFSTVPPWRSTIAFIRVK
jgi:hypothetical protein